ncbi:MAG: hypothetical protein WC412_02160, partial [Candidatus Omnitrophota bacterium]
KTYVPELLDKLNDDALSLVGYSCKCDVCKGSTPQDGSAKKGHFLLNRLSIINEMRKLDRQGRIKFMQNRLEKGIKLGDQWRRKHGVAVDLSHLQKWRNVLEIASLWELDEEDKKEEAALLKALEEE